MNHEQISNIIGSLISGICAFTYDTAARSLEFDYINDGAYRMLGVTRASGERYITRNVRNMILPQDLQIVEQWLKDVIADNGDVETVFRYVTFQGALAHMRIKGNLYERRESLNRIVCTFSDCSEEITMQREMEKQLDLMNSIVKTRSRFDYQVKTDTCVIHGTQSGDDEEEILIPNYLASSKSAIIHPDDQALFTETIQRLMQHAGRDQIEYRAKEPDGSGEYRWHQSNLMSIMDNDGYVTHVLGLIVDIHEKKLEEQRLMARADTDSLTTLLNKGATEELIRKEIETHHTKKHMDALMVIDVDDFKFINDHYGHMVGDQVLHFVGETLKENTKGMDVAGRIGGDEFLIFLQNIKSPNDTRTIADHLQDVIHNGYKDKEVAEHLSVSIGISIGVDERENYEQLFKEADSALYETKHHGKASYTLFQDEM